MTLERRDAKLHKRVEMAIHAVKSTPWLTFPHMNILVNVSS